MKKSLVFAAISLMSAAVFAQEVQEEKKFPQFKQSGTVFITPRVEINSRTDSVGKDIPSLEGKNRRRLRFGWAYNLGVAVNEKLDVNFRLADPSNAEGFDLVGSGSDLGIDYLLSVALPNAYFTYKPVSQFHFSGGLLPVARNTGLNLESVYRSGNPHNYWASSYGSTVGGLQLAFPISKEVKPYIIWGIVSSKWQRVSQVTTDGSDTIKAHNNARLLLGADLSLADKKVSLKPHLNVVSRSDTLSADSSEIKDIRPLFSGGVDMGFALVEKTLSLNANFGMFSDNPTGDLAYTMVQVGLEPVARFGGEKGNLFTFRFKWALDVFAQGRDFEDDQRNAVINHLDIRLAIAANDKFSITPRLRYWGSNNDDWYNVGLRDNDESSRSLTRFEIAFSAGF